MKSNQLNVLALLLVITTGISAEETTKIGWLDYTKSFMPTLPSMDTVKGYMPEASLKNAGIGAAVVAVPAAAITIYKKFLENKDVIDAVNGNLDSSKMQAGSYKDAFSVVLANQNLAKNGRVAEDARLNIDKACWKTNFKLQYALRKCYYNPYKVAATILGLAAAGYATHHFGLDAMALNTTKSCGSAVYGSLPTKPAWLAMPAFVKNPFAKASVTPVTQVEAIVEAVTPVTPAEVIAPVVAEIVAE